MHLRKFLLARLVHLLLNRRGRRGWLDRSSRSFFLGRRGRDRLSRSFQSIGLGGQRLELRLHAREIGRTRCAAALKDCEAASRCSFTASTPRSTICSISCGDMTSILSSIRSVSL